MKKLNCRLEDLPNNRKIHILQMGNTATLYIGREVIVVKERQQQLLDCIKADDEAGIISFSHGKNDSFTSFFKEIKEDDIFCYVMNKFKVSKEKDTFKFEEYWIEEGEEKIKNCIEVEYKGELPTCFVLTPQKIVGKPHNMDFLCFAKMYTTLNELGFSRLMFKGTKGKSCLIEGVKHQQE